MADKFIIIVIIIIIIIIRYKTIILPVVLCGCETWSLTLREECRLRVFENRILRMEEGRSALKILAGKPTGRKPLGRPRRRWEQILEWTLKR